MYSEGSECGGHCEQQEQSKDLEMADKLVIGSPLRTALRSCWGAKVKNKEVGTMRPGTKDAS